MVRNWTDFAFFVRWLAIDKKNHQLVCDIMCCTLHVLTVNVLSIINGSLRHTNKLFSFLQCRFAGPQTRPLREVLGRDTGGPGGRRAGEEGHSPEDYDKFIDLVAQMLVYDARARLRPDEALTHRFFDRKSSSSSATANVAAVAAATTAVNSTSES